MRIGIDTGGTFTDFVVIDGQEISSFKLPSTPGNPAAAIIEGLKQIASTKPGKAISEIVHGSTVATNALLERKGARTAFVTTKGFEDILEIGRQARPQIYNLMVQRPAPLVPSELRFGVDERIAADGRVVRALTPESIRELVKEIQDCGAQSVAVCLLFSFANTSHEQMLARELSKLGLPTSISSQILPEYREFERASTVTVNAYLSPLMAGYINRLGQYINDHKKDKKATPSTLRIMQSNGGTVSAATAAAEPVRTILSGPAGGVIGAFELSQKAGFNQIITFDMGGTSTDVALCDGSVKVTHESTLGGNPIAIPVIDIHTVGAGGGSIAQLDSGGALRVGPESAGADPGPACYGKGTLPTVTDANLVLGRFGIGGLLDGAFELHNDRATEVIDRLASGISKSRGKSITRGEAALGVIQVANSNMEAALRVVSVSRGYDPRLFILVCFGGAGGLHVCDLARGLRIPKILIPPDPGTLSALGVLLANAAKDYSRTIMQPLTGQTSKGFDELYADLEKRGLSDLMNEGFARNQIRILRSAAMRYHGQSFEIDIPWTANTRKLAADFHKTHGRQYGYSDASRPVELVALRLQAVGMVQKPKMKGTPAKRAYKPIPDQTAPITIDRKIVKIPQHNRKDLRPSATIDGPALIREYSSTTLILPRCRATTDRYLNLIIDVSK